MQNPLRRPRKRIFMGGEGMRLLWKMFPQAAFFEVYVPAGGEGTPRELPLIVESTESRLVEPYTKMFYRLFTARDIPLFRLLFMNVNCEPAIANRVAANLAITLASEDIVTYLLDLDLQGSELHDVFHVERTPGMAEYLLKGIEPGDITRETGVPELKFVPSGEPLKGPDEILSILGWSNTLDELIPPGIVGLIYTGSGKSFDLSELMSEVDGTLLLFSSGERVDRLVKKELKRVKKRSEVVGVIWTNPMEYPFRKMESISFEEDVEAGDEVSEEAGAPVEEGVPVVESRHLSFEGEERTGLGPEGDRPVYEGEVGGGTDRGEDAVEEDLGGDGATEEGGEDKIVEGEIVQEERVEGEKVDETAGGESAGDKIVEGEIIEEEKELEEIVEEPAGDEGDWGKPDIIDDYEEGGTKRKLWLVLLGSLFGLLVLWVLYNWGGYSDDVQVGEFEADETPAEAIPGEGASRPEDEEVQVPEVESGIMHGDFLSGTSNVPYSLVLASFRETSTAARARDELISAGFEAYLVPVEIPGQGRWTRLMLGQYSDEAEARESLQEVIAGSGFQEGRVIESSLAFLLGGFGSIGEAEEASANVEKLGLDTYILVSDGEDKGYFLYTGAFEDAGQAGFFVDILKEHGLEGELVNRRGLHL